LLRRLFTGETEKVWGLGCSFFVMAFWRFTYRVAAGNVGKILQLARFPVFFLSLWVAKVIFLYQIFTTNLFRTVRLWINSTNG
jgi:hypothetical protein